MKPNTTRFFDLPQMLEAGLTEYIGFPDDIRNLRLMTLQFIDDYGWPNPALRQFWVDLDWTLPEISEIFQCFNDAFKQYKNDPPKQDGD
jgi:hypothetical protein